MLGTFGPKSSSTVTINAWFTSVVGRFVWVAVEVAGGWFACGADAGLRLSANTAAAISRTAATMPAHRIAPRRDDAGPLAGG
jgi:hypothetical protein